MNLSTMLAKFRKANKPNVFQVCNSMVHILMHTRRETTNRRGIECIDEPFSFSLCVTILAKANASDDSIAFSFVRSHHGVETKVASKPNYKISSNPEINFVYSLPISVGKFSSIQERVFTNIEDIAV